MNILFSPEYAGTVYAKAADGSEVMMDRVVPHPKLSLFRR